MPRPEEIRKAYIDYFTHAQPSAELPGDGLLRRIYRSGAKGYISRKFGYPSPKAFSSRVLGRLLNLFPTRTRYIDFNVLHLRYQPGGRLLDIGCGSGGALRSMQRLGWTVEGIDFDPVVAAKARATGLKVHCGTLEEQGYEEDSFDAISLSHVIEHVHRPFELLKECRRILKPDRQLVVLTPNVESLSHRRFKESWLLLDPPRHLQLFSQESIKVMARRAGFRTTWTTTSARTGGRVRIGSHEIAKSGRHDAVRPLAILESIYGELIELNQGIRCLWDSAAGEELVMVAEK